MDNNKELLTFEFIKKQNNSFRNFVKIMIPILCIMIIFLIIIDYVILAFPVLVFIIVLIKNRKNLNTYIDKGEFQIVEDKIYDKYYEYHPERSSNNFEYYICSKIYGELSVSSIEYEKTQKDDSIYILIYNINKNKDNKEYKIDEKYLASLYNIDDELKKYFIPYNESLGEKKFNNRINDMINELKDKNTNVICKNCGKEYKLKKQDVCPSCHSIYQFDIKDVVHQKDWYKKEIE